MSSQLGAPTHWAFKGILKYYEAIQTWIDFKYIPNRFRSELSMIVPLFVRASENSPSVCFWQLPQVKLPGIVFDFSRIFGDPSRYLKIKIKNLYFSDYLRVTIDYFLLWYKLWSRKKSTVKFYHQIKYKKVRIKEKKKNLRLLIHNNKAEKNKILS